MKALNQNGVKKKKAPATINENHARELLELHTVSPNSGYTQEDIIQLAYICLLYTSPSPRDS